MTKSLLLRHEAELETGIQTLCLRFEADTGRRIQKLTVEVISEAEVIIVGLDYYPESDSVGAQSGLI